jgi:hypothetical protein
MYIQQLTLRPRSPAGGGDVVAPWAPDGKASGSHVQVGAPHRHLVFHGNPMRLRHTCHMTVISGPPFLVHVVTVPIQLCCVLLVHVERRRWLAFGLGECRSQLSDGP